MRPTSKRIAVAPQKVLVERVEGARRTQWEFDPRLSHVQIDSNGRQWGKRVRVYLLAPGIKLEFGRHLLDARRTQLGHELGGTLMRARAGRLTSRTQAMSGAHVEAAKAAKLQ